MWNHVQDIWDVKKNAEQSTVCTIVSIGANRHNIYTHSHAMDIP